MPNQDRPQRSSAAAPFTYLGTQLGDERSTSHVAYRFMWTGRLEVMLTGFEGCMCGEGTPPALGSPPRSDIPEAGAFSRGWWEETPAVVWLLGACVLLSRVPKCSLPFAAQCARRSRAQDGGKRCVSSYSRAASGPISAAGIGPRRRATWSRFGFCDGALQLRRLNLAPARCCGRCSSVQEAEISPSQVAPRAESGEPRPFSRRQAPERSWPIRCRSDITRLHLSMLYCVSRHTKLYVLRSRDGKSLL